MRVGGCILLLASITGCAAPELDVVAPELPEDVRWVGLILDDDDGVPVLGTGLVELGDELSVPELADASSVRLVAYREEDLSSIELPDAEVLRSGALRPARADDLRVLPEPSWTGTGQIDSGRAIVVPSSSTGPLSIDWAPVCSRDPCDQIPFDLPEVVDTPGYLSVVVLLPWTNERREGLGHSVDGKFFRLTETDEIIPLTELSTSSIFRTSLLLDDERMLLSSVRAELFEGRPESGFSNVPHDGGWRLGSSVELSAGRDASGELEVFIASRSGSIERWDGRSFTVLREGRDETEDAEIVWVAPGEAYAINEDKNELIHYREGHLTGQVLARPTALANVPGLGVVVATRTVQDLTPDLRRVTPSDLVALANVPSDIGFATEHIWPLSRGDGTFVFGGTQGELIFYHPEVGGCIMPPFGRRNVNSLIHLEGRVILGVDESDDDGGRNLVILREKSPELIPRACPSLP